MAFEKAVSGLAFFRKKRRSLFNRGVPTYILPTRFGLAFAAMVLALFFLAVGYANNLIYIFVFFLTSVAWTGTVLTNRNISGLELQGLTSGPLFATEEGEVSVRLINRHSQNSWNLEAFFPGSSQPAFAEYVKGHSAQEILVPVLLKKRGRQNLPRLTVQSRHPFSLLRAWKVFKQPMQALVFPARRGDLKFPRDLVSAEEMNSVGIFRDHRQFQSTDPVSRIDWRATARRQEILVKNYEGSEKPQLHFRWAQTAHLSDFEARLSQLSLWIDQAERQGFQYSVSIPSFKSDLGSGVTHHQNCLTPLALATEESFRE